MPPARRALPTWAQHIMSISSSAELQAGATFIIPTRTTKPRTYKYAKPYEIKPVPHRIRGTGIPASTWVKFKSGQWTPSQRTLDKLYRYWQRFSYTLMRSSGISANEARRFRGASVQKINRKIEIITTTVQEIARQKGVDPLFITWGVAQSDRTTNEWDIYTRKKYDVAPDYDDDEDEDYYLDANDYEDLEDYDE